MPATMKSLRYPSQLVEAQLVSRDRLASLQNVAARYAVAITPVLADLIDASDAADPIARQFIPDERELLQVQPEENPTRSAMARIVPLKALFTAIRIASSLNWSMPVRFTAVSAFAVKWSGRGEGGCRALSSRPLSATFRVHRKSGK